MTERHLVTRRSALALGLVAGGGLVLPGCSDDLPPTYGNLLRVGDDLTFAAQRLLVSGRALAKEYSHKEVSPFPAVGTTNPGDSFKSESGALYRRLRASAFAEWRLSVEGLVARPATFALDELKRMPSRTQITRHVCEEGWAAIGEWTGVPLRLVLEAAGTLPQARYVSVYAHDGYADCFDMLDALHPQTILAYAMSGRDLPIHHGAPLRLRVETQLGYRSMKYLHRIVARDSFDDGGKNGNIRNGWSWYAGI